MKACAFFMLLALLSLPTWAKKYVVIVNGGDNGQSGANAGSSGEVLRARFTQLAQQDAALHRSRGYEVIMVDANSGADAGDVARAIAGVRDAEELSVSIYAHGSIRQAGGVIPGQQSRHTGARVRFPIGHVRPDELANKDTDSIWNTANVFSYFMAGRERNDQVGLGDLYDALARAKLANPGMSTTLSTLSCYGGNAIRALESIPDLQVFSASDTTAPTFLLYDGPRGAPTTSLIDYNTYLIAAQQRGLSYLDAHLDAKRAYDEFALYRANGTTTSRPVNSIEMHFADMCLGAPLPSEIVACAFPASTATGSMALTRSVGQIQLHEFLTDTLNQERHFWNGVRAASCLPEFEELPMPRTILAAFLEQMTKFFDESQARLPGTDLSPFRSAMKNWSSNCALIANCQVRELRMRLEREEGYGAELPIIDSIDAAHLLRTTCPLVRAKDVANSRKHQIDCITAHGAQRPMEAMAMFSALMDKVSDHMAECRRAESGLELTTRLASCQRNLTDSGDDEFWHKMLSLIQLGSRTP